MNKFSAKIFNMVSEGFYLILLIQTKKKKLRIQILLMKKILKSNCIGSMKVKLKIWKNFWQERGWKEIMSTKNKI